MLKLKERACLRGSNVMATLPTAGNWNDEFLMNGAAHVTAHYKKFYVLGGSIIFVTGQNRVAETGDRKTLLCERVL